MHCDRIIGIYRIDQRQYLEYLIDGKLRFRPLICYRNLEKDESGRADDAEGAMAFHQPSPGKDWIYLIPKCGPQAGRPIKFTLTGPMTEIADASNLSILCFSKMVRSDFQEFVAGMSYQYCLNPQMAKFGDSVLVIKNIYEFLRRFKTKAGKIGLVFGNASVDYVDEKTFDGPIEGIGFTKLKDPFSYQNEYRLAIAFEDAAPDEYYLDIGSLRDIACIQPLIKLE